MGLDSVSIVLVYSRFFFFLGTVWMYQYSLGFEVSFLLDISIYYAFLNGFKFYCFFLIVIT